ncbi:YraN family protein [Stella sp.]|uniref:YraN family protein n=1 Tax=Stella sp. TaxID=2912054 RepID=UPI0035B479F7
MTRPPRTAAGRRGQAERRGRRAETWAAWLLRLKGYRILARRWRGRSGEIDLVARRGRTLAIVEVKLRQDRDRAAQAATGRGPARIGRAAAEYLAGRPDLHPLDVRFDLVLASPGRLPRHLPDAWRP